MAEPQKPSLLRRWLTSLLFLYALVLVIYLLLRWIVQANWSLLLLGHTIAFYLFLPVIAGLVIAMLLRARRLAGFYWLLTIIGLVWFVPRMMPPLSEPQQNGTSLKIISFNMFPENQRLDDVTTWLLAQDADVIGLQEIGVDLPLLADEYPYFVSQDVVNGQALFSRYPIQMTETVQLGDIPQQRHLLNINGLPVVLYNLHLYMPLNEDESQTLFLRYDESRRNRQINELLTFIAGENQPTIVMGDFNMSEFSPIYGRLNARLHDAYRVTSWGLGQTWPGGASEELGDNFPPLFRLDYVWYTDGIQALEAQVGSRLGSDHLPLIVNLDIRG
ncbi:MAG: endonuclease/exonuclease/phosphatase family protein [Anaerolineae bacterium]|nr:endonuclease/exonuclease/phosphatase family protein [Anaerolineae bacterium]MDQ7033501.1 endonuclease/exonuclease/phosphatase family protein [Anaerolineae bacterium]